ncbi:MAG: efflux RND transporter periplasmic adaptor subunit [Gemmataceae bacterium]|nr:efflux RND transporter periplasmic adaptor subunit [Gemmataceae bacterium]MCI0738497.1 efflux RND transporter periplasmic adaptor subunit [Gemmataceae bacterium]
MLHTEPQMQSTAVSQLQSAAVPLPTPRIGLPSAKRSRPWMGRLVRLVLIGGAVVGLGWAGWSWAISERKAAEVLTATAAKGDLVITVVERGELESAKSTQVVCEVEGGGKLASIVAEGTRVKKDQEVLRFDVDVLLKSINEQEVKWEQAEGKAKTAKAELEVQRNKSEGEIAKAELALTLANIDHESYEEGEYQVEVDRRKGTLELGKKELKEAEDNLAFTRDMVKKGFSQLEQIRVMELQAEGKRYQVRQQEADLRVFEKFTRLRKTTELKAKAEDAKRDLERTKKSQAAAVDKNVNELQGAEKTAGLEKRHLERLKAQLDKCVVKAPQDGIVIYFKRPWDESSRIRTGANLFYQQPIFTLPDLDNMQVSLKVHESVVKKVKKGQEATMQIDALPNQVLNGKVLYVATLAAGDEWRGGGGVKEYKTEVSIDDLPTDAGLRPGMTAEVKIYIKTVADAVTVPVQAVTELDGKQICYVVKGADIERRTVQVGDANQQLIQILEGVSEGERVALDARVRAAAELKKQESKGGGPKKDDSQKKKKTISN